MPTQPDPEGIAVLTAEVRHLTQAVTKLSQDVEGHRNDVQTLLLTTSLLDEKGKNAKERSDIAFSKLSKLEARLVKLEMETWKLGLLIGGSATGGGLFAVLAQYLLKVFTT